MQKCELIGLFYHFNIPFILFYFISKISANELLRRASPVYGYTGLCKIMCPFGSLFYSLDYVTSWKRPSLSPHPMLLKLSERINFAESMHQEVFGTLKRSLVSVTIFSEHVSTDRHTAKQQIFSLAVYAKLDLIEAITIQAQLRLELKSTSLQNILRAPF